MCTSNSALVGKTSSIDNLHGLALLSDIWMEEYLRSAYVFELLRIKS